MTAGAFVAGLTSAARAPDFEQGDVLAYEWRIDRQTRTIVVRGVGTGTTADTLRLIEELAPTLAECSDHDFLYDAVQLSIDSSPADMMKVADALFGHAGARFRRFAIVVPPARVPMGRIFVALADPYGVVANVFADVESALEWLATPSKPRPTRPSAPNT